MKAFPQPDILVVVDAPIPEFAEEASNKLAEALAAGSDFIRGVHQLDSGSFFARNGLLLLPTEETTRVTSGLVQATPLIQTLSTDPSLRGSLNALSFGLMIAIPSLMLYRYFRGRVDEYQLAMELAAERMVPHLMRFAVRAG